MGLNLENSRKKKSSAPIEQEIAAVEDKVVKRAAAEATDSVVVSGYGRYYRRLTGGWVGPGGYFGPGTRLAQMCEQELKKQKEK